MNANNGRRATRVVLCATVLTLVGCVGMADYLGPPPGASEYGSGQAPVDPDTFAVDSHKFPHFRVAAPFSPPRWISIYNPNVESGSPMVEIQPSDIWRVTHVVRNVQIIQSDSYTLRQCEFLAAAAPHGTAGGFKSLLGGECSTDYLYGIYIDPAGHLAGGWVLLRNPKQAFLKADRRTYFVPLADRNKGWEGIEFVVAK